MRGSRALSGFALFALLGCPAADPPLTRAEPPLITSFTADWTQAPPGTSVTFAFTVQRASELSLIDQDGTQLWLTGDMAQGTATATLSRSSVFLLTAKGEGGRDAAFVHVEVAGGQFQLLNMAPAAGEVGVATDAEVTAQFSEAVAPASVDEGTLTVTGPAGIVPGQVTSSSNEVRFSASRPLSLAADFTAALSAGIRDAQDRPLSAVRSWQFTTRDGIWSQSTQVTSKRGIPSVAALPGREYLVGWLSDYEGLFASWRRADGTWSAPEVITSSEDSYSLFDLDLGADAEGRVHALWRRLSGSNGSVVGTRCWTPEGGWGAERLLVNLPPGIYLGETALAVSPGGSAVAAWSSGAKISGIWSFTLTVARFDPVEGWGSPTQLPTSSEVWPVTSIDAQGGAMVLFVDAGTVRAVRFQPGTGWMPIDVLDTGSFRDVSVTSSPDGAATAAWVRGGTAVMVARWVPDSGWTIPQRLDPDGMEAGGPRLSAGGDGSVYAVWSRAAYNGRASLMGRRFVPGVGWQAVMKLDDVGIGQDVVADRAGNALFLWSRDAYGGGYVRVLRDGTMIGPVMMDFAGGSMSASPDGRVIAAWPGQDDGIWAAAFE